MPIKEDKKIVERSTRQQGAILEALYGVDEFKSAQDIHALLSKKKLKVGLATVYRTLQKMAEKEDIDAIKSIEGETLYRHCGQNDGHHHHLILLHFLQKWLIHPSHLNYHRHLLHFF